MIKKSNTKTKAMATVTVTLAVNLMAIADARASSDADYTFLISSDWHDCQQISAEYQEVYAFETENFYVNICQKDQLYFYLGEAKQRDKNSIFIPAYPLKNNSGFRAKNGNVSYLVILPFSQYNDHELEADRLDPAEAILTIKRNGQLISVESSLNKYCHQIKVADSLSTIKPQSQNSQSLATAAQQQDTGSDLLFTPQRDRLSSAEIFQSDSPFDFYQIGGELHRLTSCNQ